MSRGLRRVFRFQSSVFRRTPAVDARFLAVRECGTFSVLRIPANAHLPTHTSVSGRRTHFFSPCASADLCCPTHTCQRTLAYAYLRKRTAHAHSLAVRECGLVLSYAHLRKRTAHKRSLALKRLEIFFCPTRTADK